MALFHLSVTQTKRSAGQSAIASAAYRAGERLYSEYYGEYSDYTRKGGVICSDILLPSHAPPEYADRQTLWNAVEKAERGKNAQLAYSFDIALQNEFSLEENIALARQFLLENFVSRGMVVDFAVHQPDREDGGIPNPHFHVLCPIRPIEQNGKWGLKQRRVYELDEDGNRIRDADGKFVFNAVPTTDWGSPETLEHWREAWAELCNAKFAEKGIDVRIDHRSYERQGVDLLPTIELMIGQSSTEAERKRAARLENKALLPSRTKGGHLSDIRPPEIEIELEKEIEIEKEREGETGHPAPAAYGRYNNVILTDTELSGLKTELPDKWEYYIDRLSCHIASTGKQYHSHAATIYKWAQEDAAKGKAAPKQGIPDYSCKEGESL